MCYISKKRHWTNKQKRKSTFYNSIKYFFLDVARSWINCLTKLTSFQRGGICSSWVGLPSKNFRDFYLSALERLINVEFKFTFLSHIYANSSWVQISYFFLLPYAEIVLEKLHQTPSASFSNSNEQIWIIFGVHLICGISNTTVSNFNDNSCISFWEIL